MKKVFSKTVKFAGRVFESMIPDEETAKRMSEQYVRTHSLDSFTR